MLKIRYDNKIIEKRGLEEQVRKNQEDIARHYEIDRVIADFGLSYQGQVNTYEDLLILSDKLPVKEYGDMYAVGIAPPYEYYVWSRPNPNIGEYTEYWFNLGNLNIVGPQGPQGDKGEKGDTGASTRWYVSSTALLPDTSKYNEGDLYFNTSNYGVYQFISIGTGGYVWVKLNNVSLQGPQGPQGIQGQIGATGPKGDKGDKGDKGEPALPFQIEGVLLSTSALPSPTEEIRDKAYLIEINGVDHLYAIIPNDSGILVWRDIGPLEAVQGEIGPQGPQGITPYLEIRNSNELYVSYDNRATFQYLYTIPSAGGTTEITTDTLLNLMEESPTIVPSKDNTSNLVQFDLAVDTLNEITRSVKLPVSNPSATKLFGVNSNGEQILIGASTGITLAGNYIFADVDTSNLQGLVADKSGGAPTDYNVSTSLNMMLGDLTQFANLGSNTKILNGQIKFTSSSIIPTCNEYRCNISMSAVTQSINPSISIIGANDNKVYNFTLSMIDTESDANTPAYMLKIDYNEANYVGNIYIYYNQFDQSSNRFFVHLEGNNFMGTDSFEKIIIDRDLSQNDSGMEVQSLLNDFNVNYHTFVVKNIGTY